MKILYCLAGTFNSGGMERIIIAKANWFATQGHEVMIVTTEQSGRSDFFELHPSIRRIDFDVLYSNTLNYNPVRKYFVRKKRMKAHFRQLKTLVYKESPDVIISSFGNEVGMVPKLRCRALKIAEIHFAKWYRMQLNRKGIWKLIDRYLTKTDEAVLSKYDKFVCLTHEDQHNWRGHNNVEVIPNFIDNKHASPASLNNQAMIAVGRLSYQKGYDRLIKAWEEVHKKYPEWKLDIYGGGELKEELTKLISTLGLDGIVSIHKPVANIMEVYPRYSAHLLSSHYEGLPMVILEAMAAGLPTIAYTCQCGPKDIIVDGQTGILVEEGNISALSQSIIKLIEDEKLRRKLGDGAYKRIDQFTRPRIMRLWESLLSANHTNIDR